MMFNDGGHYCWNHHGPWWKWALKQGPIYFIRSLRQLRRNHPDARIGELLMFCGPFGTWASQRGGSDDEADAHMDEFGWVEAAMRRRLLLLRLRRGADTWDATVHDDRLESLPAGDVPDLNSVASMNSYLQGCALKNMMEAAYKIELVFSEDQTQGIGSPLISASDLEEK